MVHKTAHTVQYTLLDGRACSTLYCETGRNMSGWTDCATQVNKRKSVWLNWTGWRQGRLSKQYYRICLNIMRNGIHASREIMQCTNKHVDTNDDVPEWEGRRCWLWHPLDRERVLATALGTADNEGSENTKTHWWSLLHHLLWDAASGKQHLHSFRLWQRAGW